MDFSYRDVPNFVLGDIEDMSMFADRQFGAVFCSHVLENVKNLDAAKRELARVADYQFIITPSPLSIIGWLSPWHVRVFKDNHGGEVLAELPPKPWL
jgi:ubiquinone/menaquinone biosynthesis C-methylase UbiE